jgi:5-deoxy-glucuronate isomerase
VDRPVAAAALPNALAPDELRLRPGANGAGLAVDPERAGWRYLSFRSVALAAGEVLDIGADDRELAVVTISGGGAVVEVDGARLELHLRPDAFDGMPSAAYLPAGCSGRLIAEPARDRAVLAIAEAPADRAAASEPRRIGPEDVRVEIRGAGNATRQVNHIIEPDFPAQRLEVVEVLTPSGNWSSWPPHKHDTDDMPREAVLEEVYFYQFRRREAWGLQRLYREDGSRDAAWAVGHGDLVLVTDGYHPFVATHGDDAYYLNALAGDRRTMACSFDPALDWVRERWADMALDPRVPLVLPVR